MSVKVIGPSNANIMIVGEAPGEQEMLVGKPFLGRNGELLSKILGQSGVTRHDCLLTNVVDVRPPGGNIQYFFANKSRTKPAPPMLEQIERLKREIEEYKPNIVIALGKTALWALTGESKIGECRGFIFNSTLVPGVKVLPTYNPGFIHESWEVLFPAIMDVRKAVNNSKTPGLFSDKRSLKTTPSLNEFIDYLDYCLEVGTVAVDIETVSPGSHIDIFGIGVSKDDAMSFTVVKGRKPVLSTVGAEMKMWLKIAEVMDKCKVIMHNGMYDATVLAHNCGIPCNGYTEDTMVQAHCCWPETPRSLNFITSICLNVPAWKHMQSDQPQWYNANDVANTFGCWEVLNEEIAKNGHINTYRFEMSQTELTDYLQLRGIKIDTERQKELITEAKKEAEATYEAIKSILGYDINLNSPKQLAKLLYGELGLPVQYKRRKSANDAKTVTTDKDAIMKLARAVDNPVLNLILQHRKAVKLLTFLDIKLSPEGRAHTSYNITGATMSRTTSRSMVVDDEEGYKSFGRWSSSKSIILPYGSGNLQNIPNEARKMYVPDGEGKVLIQADYKQAEAVVVSYIINDSSLKRMFQASYGKSNAYCKEHGLDVHKLTAAMLFGVHVDEITPEQRKIGKTIRHANSYSAGPKVVADKLGCTMREAKEFLESYHNKVPQLRLWYKEVQAELAKTRVLSNLLGRKHKFLKRWGDQLFRSAYSFVPQSTVGDLLNTAIVDYARKYMDEAPIVLQLHDAFYVQCDDDPEVIQRVKYNMYSCMSIPITYKGETFCIDVDFKVGKSWGEMEEQELRL